MVRKFCGNTLFLRITQNTMEKHNGNGIFPQNFHTRKLDEVLAFYAVFVNVYEENMHVTVNSLTFEKM